MPSVSEVICDALVAAGVSRVWTVGAAAIDGFLETARRHPLLVVEGVATEKDAAFAADGGTRVATAPGVGAFIGSVGLGVAMAGIQTAVLERRPVLFLVGQVDVDAAPLTLQDTRDSHDAAVVAATGCPTWAVHSPPDLSDAWSAAAAHLAQGDPACLLVDESVFRSEATGQLPQLGRPAGGRSPFRGEANLVAAVSEDSSSLTRAALFRAVAAKAPGADVFADAGQGRLVGAQLAAAGLDIRLHHCPRSASLGWALPAATGAALTIDRRVFAVGGDGGLLHSLSALADLGRRGAPVTVLTGVNGIMGVDAARDREVPPDVILPAVDLAEVARSLGVSAVTAHTPADLAGALMWDDGPRLIVARVPAFETPSGVVP